MFAVAALQLFAACGGVSRTASSEGTASATETTRAESSSTLETTASPPTTARELPLGTVEIITERTGQWRYEFTPEGGGQPETSGPVPRVLHMPVGTMVELRLFDLWYHAPTTSEPDVVVVESTEVIYPEPGEPEVASRRFTRLVAEHPGRTELRAELRGDCSLAGTCEMGQVISPLAVRVTVTE